MITDRRKAYRHVVASYGAAGPITQAFVAARLLIAEPGALADELSGRTGTVLSLGCGHGALERYLSTLNPQLRFTGLELDGGRVAVAAKTGDDFPGVRVLEQDVTALDADPHDLAIAVDVFHHIDGAAQPAIFRALATRVRPGGICLVKDIATSPRWKHRWNATHDRLVAGETQLHCRDPEDMAAVAAAAGFIVDGHNRLGRYSPYPHYLLRLRVPSA